MNAANTERLWFGCGYYPEWCDPSRWPDDARMMRDIGFNCVRLGDFCWSRLEPREGDFRLGWLEDAIGVLGDHGIHTMLTLPTVGPPRWVSLSYPETLPVRRDGQRMPFGSRNHLCINAPAGRRLNLRLLDVLLDRFAGNSHIFSWTLGNEIGKHYSCYCDICLGCFQDWLRSRYASIEALNDAWGTVFWSQEYADFDEVVHPIERPNPSLHLDWQRFRSDSLIGFCKPQIDRIRQAAPGRVVTVNFRLAPDEHDCFELANELDVVGANYYPGPMTPEEQRHSHYLDLFRGIGRQRPFWIMEAQTGVMPIMPKEDFANPLSCCLLPSPAPGEVRRWAYASVAAGANMLNYYLWQSPHFGDECLEGSILDNAGHPRQGLVDELKRTITELKAVEPFCTEVVRSEVAVLFDYPSWWANRTYRLTEPFSHLALRQEFVQAFYRLGVPCDLIDIGQLDAYKLVVVPNMQIVTADDQALFEAFVRGGGHLLVTFGVGKRDISGQIVRDPLPGRLASLVGATVDKSEPLTLDEQIGLRFSFCEELCFGRVWTDTVAVDRAEAIGHYEGGILAGKACLSRHRLGEGVAYYLGALPDAVGMSAVLAHAMEAAQVAPLVSVPENVIVGRRSGPSGESIFLVNYNGHDVVCDCNNTPVSVRAHDVIVLRKEG